MKIFKAMGVKAIAMWLLGFPQSSGAEVPREANQAPPARGALEPDRADLRPGWARLMDRKTGERVDLYERVRTESDRLGVVFVRTDSLDEKKPFRMMREEYSNGHYRFLVDCPYSKKPYQVLLKRNDDYLSRQDKYLVIAEHEGKKLKGKLLRYGHEKYIQFHDPDLGRVIQFHKSRLGAELIGQRFTHLPVVDGKLAQKKGDSYPVALPAWRFREDLRLWMRPQLANSPGEDGVVVVYTDREPRHGKPAGMVRNQYAEGSSLYLLGPYRVWLTNKGEIKNSHKGEQAQLSIVGEDDYGKTVQLFDERRGLQIRFHSTFLSPHFGKRNGSSELEWISLYDLQKAGKAGAML